MIVQQKLRYLGVTYDIRCKVKRCLKLFTPFVLKNGEVSVY